MQHFSPREKFIAHDPKLISFAQLLSKDETIFQSYSQKGGGGRKKGKKGDKNKTRKKTQGGGNHYWKYAIPNKGEVTSKKFRKNTYQ